MTTFLTQCPYQPHTSIHLRSWNRVNPQWYSRAKKRHAATRCVCVVLSGREAFPSSVQLGRAFFQPWSSVLLTTHLLGRGNGVGRAMAMKSRALLVLLLSRRWIIGFHVHGKAFNATYEHDLMSTYLGRSRSSSWRRTRASGPSPSWRSVDHPSRSLRSVEPALQALPLNFESTILTHPARLVHPLGHLQCWVVFLRQSGPKQMTMKYPGKSLVLLLPFL